MEPLAQALGISVIELIKGEDITNSNVAANMLRSQFYVCPVCGNVIRTIGQAVVSCCGITLPQLEAEAPDADHAVKVDLVEDEYFVEVDHPMVKDHYISFVAAVSDDGVQFTKLYPEGNPWARFKASRVRWICYYCNRHGFYRVKINKKDLSAKEGDR